MPETFPTVIRELGATDLLDYCLRGLQRQRRRLRRARGNWSLEAQFHGLVPDIWFVLSLLNATESALALAVDAFPDHSSGIEEARRELLDQTGVKKSRDVYTHLDEYYRGSGRLQRHEGWRRDMHLPQVLLAGETSTGRLRSIEVRIASDSVDLFPAIAVAIRALRKTQALIGADV